MTGLDGVRYISRMGLPKNSHSRRATFGTPSFLAGVTIAYNLQIPKAAYLAAQGAMGPSVLSTQLVIGDAARGSTVFDSFALCMLTCSGGDGLP